MPLSGNNRPMVHLRGLTALEESHLGKKTWPSIAK